MERDILKVSPIGYVRLSEEGFYIEVKKEYAAALKNIGSFSHVNVLWWCHLLDDEQYRTMTEVEQPYKNSPAVLGIFATRSPVRPNPIALTTATIIHVDEENGKIQVGYMDAEEGTPVLDIKPYHPSTDRVRGVSVPEWCSHWPQWYEDSADFDWEAEFVNAR